MRRDGHQCPFTGRRKPPGVGFHPPGFPQGEFESYHYDWQPIAARIEAPTLVVHGAEDPMPLDGSTEWKSAFPNARLEVIPGAGHYPHAEQPDRFFPAVEGFLGRSQ